MNTEVLIFSSVFTLVASILLSSLLTVLFILQDGRTNALLVFFLIFLTVMLFCSCILIPTNLFDTEEEAYYTVGLTYERTCDLYSMIENNKFVRDHLETYIEDSSEHIWGVQFSTRVHDKDKLQEAISKLDFEMFDSKKEVYKWLCEQKGPEYEIKFDNKCVRCN